MPGFGNFRKPVVTPCRGLGERQPRHERRLRFANVYGRYSRVREGHLAQRVLLQRDLYRLLKRQGRGLYRLLGRGCFQEPQYGYDSQDELEWSSQLRTPAA